MIFRLPIEMIPEIMGDLEHAKERKVEFEIQSVPALSLYYNGMLCTGLTLNKKEVRLAFNYAIDRQKLVDYTLQGEGIPGIYGVVPPVEAFEQQGYNFKSLKGYSFDPALAKEYLAKAGYPNGKGFPKVTLQLNSAGGERNEQIAEVIQKSLKENLNIDNFNDIFNINNIEVLGNILYTDYYLYFIIGAFILLTAMIGAIILTISHEQEVKRQDLFAQITTKYNTNIKNKTC